MVDDKKTKYFQLGLFLLDEHYMRIPYGVLQVIRQSRTHPLYDGTSTNNEPMSHHPIDGMMELCMPKYKKMSFGNTVDSWLRHSRYMPLATKASVHVDTEYITSVRALEIADGGKQHNRKKTMKPRQRQEQILMTEWLVKSKALNETPNRKLHDKTFWLCLSDCNTDLAKIDDDTETETNENGEIEHQTREREELNEIVRTLIGADGEAELNTNTSNEAEGETIVGSFLVSENEDSEDEAEPNIEISVAELTYKGKPISVKPFKLHPLAAKDVSALGQKKMDEMGIGKLRERKQQRLAREQKMMQKDLFSFLHNERRTGLRSDYSGDSSTKFPAARRRFLNLKTESKFFGEDW